MPFELVRRADGIRGEQTNFSIAWAYEILQMRAQYQVINFVFAPMQLESGCCQITDDHLQIVLWQFTDSGKIRIST